MRYGSVCSGVEAASVAWHPLGWKPIWFSEIEPFCTQVLARRFPEVPNHGDFTQICRDPSHPARREPIDLLVGGTPCQDFSVAGLHAGLEGDRGQLTLEFCRLAALLRPRWIVWENVPGAMQTNGGRALGALLGALGELGYHLAWRILDAQHFGLAQRRARLFVVGHLGGDGAFHVLLEPERLPRHLGSRRKAGKIAPPGATQGPQAGDLAGALTASRGGADENDAAQGRLVVMTQDGERADPLVTREGSTYTQEGSNNFRLRNLVAFTPVEAVAFKASHFTRGKDGAPSLVAPPLSADADRGDQDTLVLQPAEDVVVGPRRLTPLECERLQGFPDGWTLIQTNKPSGPRSRVAQLRAQHGELVAGWTDEEVRSLPADSPRYRALGNSMAVPVMRWIGERIDAYERAEGSGGAL